MEGYVKSELIESIQHITFYHQAHNSLPSNLLAELAQQILEAGKDENVLAILLKSAGDRTFCAGASFTELISIESFDAGHTFFMGFANVINAIRTCGKIVVGRVHGKAVGGGVGLASACDYTCATKYASIRLSELAVGIGPFVIGPAVERKIGKSDFAKIALTPDEWQTAQWAKDKGMFAEAFDSVEQLDAYIEHFLTKLRTYNPEALATLKRINWEGTEDWDQLLSDRAEASGRLILSDFSKKAIGQFLQA